MPPRTLFEKIWDAHVVREAPGEPTLLYIDLHLVHEVTSPQAFEGLRLSGRKVRRPDLTIATMDHNTPTWPLSEPVVDQIAKEQLDALERNCREFGIRLEDRFSPLQGIVHVIGPELGLTQPGITVVCGDSHTSTHGALGALVAMLAVCVPPFAIALAVAVAYFARVDVPLKVKGAAQYGMDVQVPGMVYAAVLLASWTIAGRPPGPETDVLAVLRRAAR